MTESNSSSQKTPPAELPSKPRSSRWSLIGSVLGTLGWLGLTPFLSACDQPEQLARYFAGFVNLWILGMVGGVSTVMLYLAYPFMNKPPAGMTPDVAPVSQRIALYGMIVGAFVIILYLPVSIWVML